jgi:hypothetical protein
MIARIGLIPSERDLLLEQGGILVQAAHESHAVSRTRHIPVASMEDLAVVIAALYVEGFTGQLRIDFSQGGFSHVRAEESLQLVSNEQNS